MNVGTFKLHLNMFIVNNLVSFYPVGQEDKLTFFLQYLWNHTNQFIAQLFCHFMNNKSDIKRQSSLCCLDQYIYKGLSLWNSWDCEAV